MSKNLHYIFFVYFSFIFSSTADCQQLTTMSEYSALSKVYYPASIVSPASVSVNVVSLSAGLWNNAYDFRKGYLLSNTSEIGVEGKDFFKNVRSNEKYGAYNVDLIGPSVNYRLKQKHFIGISTRFRQVVRLSRLNGEIFRLFNNLDEKFFQNDLEQRDLGLNIHSFSEIGFSYGRQIYERGKHSVSAGATLKYLMGGSAASIFIPDINVNIQDISTINKLNGQVNILYSQNVKTLSAAVTSGFVLPDQNAHGLGFDLGLSYRYGKRDTDYMLKANIAVTDIGGIRYASSANSQRLRFNADSTEIENINRLRNETLNGYINRMKQSGFITPLSRENTFKMMLPTALRMNVDFKPGYNIGFNADVLINCISDNFEDVHVATYSNTLMLTPRYQRKWYSVGLPLMFNSVSPASLGIMLRGGPFFIGSSSLISNLFGRNINHTDACVGLAWSF